MGRTTPSVVSGWDDAPRCSPLAGLAAAIEAAILLAALAALAELQPVSNTQRQNACKEHPFLVVLHIDTFFPLYN